MSLVSYPSIKNKRGKTAYDVAPLNSAVKQLLSTTTFEHRKSLQGVAEKAVAARWKTQVPEDISAQVQEMLRPTPEEIVD